MERTLEAVRDLRPGEYLRMVHRQEPRLLYPMLEKLGMEWHTRERMPIEVLIYRRGDEVASEAVAAIIAAEA